MQHQKQRLASRGSHLNLVVRKDHLLTRSRKEYRERCALPQTNVHENRKKRCVSDYIVQLDHILDSLLSKWEIIMVTIDIVELKMCVVSTFEAVKN